jgi:hypothetical protein
MHPIRTLTWAVPTSWADAANGLLVRVNIYGIITFIKVRKRKESKQACTQCDYCRSSGIKWGLKITLVAVFEFRFFCWPDVNNEKKKKEKKASRNTWRELSVYMDSCSRFTGMIRRSPGWHERWNAPGWSRTGRDNKWFLRRPPFSLSSLMVAACMMYSLGFLFFLFFQIFNRERHGAVERAVRVLFSAVWISEAILKKVATVWSKLKKGGWFGSLEQRPSIWPRS